MWRSAALCFCALAICIAPFSQAQTCKSAEAAAPAKMAHKQLMIPGPIEFSEDVLAAAGGLAMSHVDPAFISEFGEAIELLRKVFLTEKGQPFVVSGSGTLGWDMVACNLIEPGQNVLIVNTGYFGDRFGETFEAYGIQVTHLRAPAIGDRPSIKDIEEALTNAPPGGYQMITVTHVDTSTGVLIDVEAVAALLKEKFPDVLLVVDGVCSAGGETIKMDEWNVAAVLTASQKALGTPPGLSVMVVGESGMKVFEERKAPINNYYGSLKKWLPIMKSYEARKPSYFATPAVQLVQALRVSLKQMLEQTPDILDRFAKHVAVSDRVKSVVTGWGLKLVPVSHEKAAHTMTAVYMPEGMVHADLLPKVVAKGVMLAGGLHPDIATKYFRIGHMGISVMDDDRQHIDKVLDVLKEALTEAGVKLNEATATA